MRQDEGYVSQSQMPQIQSPLSTHSKRMASREVAGHFSTKALELFSRLGTGLLSLFTFPFYRLALTLPFFPHPLSPLSLFGEREIKKEATLFLRDICEICAAEEKQGGCWIEIGGLERGRRADSGIRKTGCSLVFLQPHGMGCNARKHITLKTREVRGDEVRLVTLVAREEEKVRWSEREKGRVRERERVMGRSGGGEMREWKRTTASAINETTPLTTFGTDNGANVPRGWMNRGSYWVQLGWVGITSAIDLINAVWLPLSSHSITSFSPSPPLSTHHPASLRFHFCVFLFSPFSISPASSLSSLSISSHLPYSFLFFKLLFLSHFEKIWDHWGDMKKGNSKCDTFFCNLEKIISNMCDLNFFLILKRKKNKINPLF